ncbi:hypothetical protein PIB30_004726 [Stylosanthes scabra]|uniref:Uncharacterized protein n=1 Tax=Stylosanthes scabra TaxID=79078 RepID=A0ABU6S3J0_9FABA|nr:hypothetical protein [Stylosanthes scabra]
MLSPTIVDLSVLEVGSVHKSDALVARGSSGWQTESFTTIERREKYEDSDERADSNLAVVKTRRYHFDNEAFIHPLHSVRFDPKRPCELPVESLLALKRKES